MFRVLLFFLFPLTSTVNIAKLNITYKFLAAKSRATNSNYLMNDYFGATIQGIYNSYCNSNRCYFPVFKNDSGTLIYTILTDTSSNYNCLNFTQEQYQNYTIVFGNPKIVGGDNFTDLAIYKMP